MEGIIKRWHSDRNWGLIYSPGDQRFFLHLDNIAQGTPALMRRVTFDVSPARSPGELPRAVNVIVAEEVNYAQRGTRGRP